MTGVQYGAGEGGEVRSLGQVWTTSPWFAFLCRWWRWWWCAICAICCTFSKMCPHCYLQDVLSILYWVYTRTKCDHWSNQMMIVRNYKKCHIKRHRKARRTSINQSVFFQATNNDSPMETVLEIAASKLKVIYPENMFYFCKVWLFQCSPNIQ